MTERILDLEERNKSMKELNDSKVNEIKAKLA
jgi:hypothetical protein